MKISELFDEMAAYFGKLDEGAVTCDTYKAGNPDNEVSGVCISMFATPEVIKKCTDRNINFLIVHEPVFYNHMDDHIPNKLAELKKEFIEKSGITIARYHDHAHIPGNDLIYEGEIKYSKLVGRKIITDMFAVNRFEYNKAVLVMGHIGSERAGMVYLADILKKKHPELNINYIECEEVYSYTDE